jgi:hypothetical protein
LPTRPTPCSSPAILLLLIDKIRTSLMGNSIPGGILFPQIHSCHSPIRVIRVKALPFCKARYSHILMLDREKDGQVKSSGFTVSGSEAGGGGFALRPVDHHCTGAMPEGLARMTISQSLLPFWGRRLSSVGSRPAGNGCLFIFCFYPPHGGAHDCTRKDVPWK